MTTTTTITITTTTTTTTTTMGRATTTTTMTTTTTRARAGAMARNPKAVATVGVGAVPRAAAVLLARLGQFRNTRPSIAHSKSVNRTPRCIFLKLPRPLLLPRRGCSLKDGRF